MVLGLQIVPAHPSSATINRHPDPQVASQTDRVRHRALHVAAHPSLTRHPRGRHPLRSTPRPRPARRARAVFHALRRRRRVHDRRRDVPFRDHRRPRAPAAACHGLARAICAPLDGHLDRGLLELPLAPILPKHLHHIWRAPRGCAPWAARCAIWRVRRVRHIALRWLVGAREGDGAQQRRVLRSDGRRGGPRARLVAHDRHGGAGFLGLGLDDDVDPFLGYVYAGWVGTTRHDCMRLFFAWATTRETDRRCYRFSDDEPLTNVSNWISDSHRGQTQHTYPHVHSVGKFTYNLMHTMTRAS